VPLKGTPRTCRGVPRSWEVPPGLDKGLGEEHSPVEENWSHDGVEMEFERREQERGEQR